MPVKMMVCFFLVLRVQILRGLEQGISGGGGVPPMLVGTDKNLSSF